MKDENLCNKHLKKTNKTISKWIGPMLIFLFPRHLSNYSLYHAVASKHSFCLNSSSAAKVGSLV